MSANILIIEDELRIARIMELEFKREGFDVKIAPDGNEGLEEALSSKYDLIILDLMLPGINGIEICRRVRKSSDVPIIMVTARDDTMDKVTGLDMGADDYITKPFAMEELLARTRSALRRSEKSGGPKADNTVLKVGKLTLDKRSHQALYDSKPLELTKREFDLLSYMLENIGAVLTREILLEKVWGFDYYGDTNVVDVYVRYLRSKIDDLYGEHIIHTVRGVGYMIKDSNGDGESE